MPTITKLFSLKEVAEHNTRDDCWVVIHDKVYDVTKYLDDHPGGDDVLLAATGKDSTEDFEDAGHSEDARELMEDYFIGEIDTSPLIPQLEIFTEDGEKPSGFTHKLMNKGVQYWALPATAITVSMVVAAFFYVRKK